MPEAVFWPVPSSILTGFGSRMLPVSKNALLILTKFCRDCKTIAFFPLSFFSVSLFLLRLHVGNSLFLSHFMHFRQEIVTILYTSHKIR